MTTFGGFPSASVCEPRPRMSPAAANVFNWRVAERSPSDLPLWARAYRAASSAYLVMVIVGALAAAAHQRFGAYLLIAYVVLQIGSHIGIGFYGYREVMAREWPTVASQSDDDDW
jgi:hypothetical protein